MSRIILLPTTGNPFTLLYWIKHYKQKIASEVDKIIIGQYGPTYSKYIDIISVLCNDNNISFVSEDGSYYDAGKSLETAYLSLQNKGNKQDTILLMESDCFVFNKQILNQYFSMIENNHVGLVGSQRDAYIDLVLDQPTQAQSFYQIKGLWPCFLYSNSYDFHIAYEKSMEYMLGTLDYVKKHEPERLGKKYRRRKSAFNHFRGNEEDVVFTFCLQHYMENKRKHIIDMPRASARNNKILDWIHFGIYEQLPLDGNILRDIDGTTVLRAPGSFPIESLLEENISAYALDPIFLGMYKACVLTANEVIEFQSRHLDAINRAINVFNYNSQKIDFFAKTFAGWIGQQI